jgi:predicted glycoside hydrolase/deacetylase ChbG (UPF0249 family)
MKKYTFLHLLILLMAVSSGFCQKFDPGKQVYLLVRGDDIGSSHAANLGCIESYENGIMRSVELMPSCPWFPEAVKMLKDKPGLDVGIHLALTSEWDNIKWGPITDAPSISDEDGYFYPMVWKRNDFSPNTSLQEADWDIDEIESEFRAQIELALKYVPRASHAGVHMGAAGLNEEIGVLVARLLKEYDLDIDMKSFGFKRFNGWGDARTLEERIDNFTAEIDQLDPGFYLFIDHPAVDSPEMQSIWHPGYENVATDRDWVTRVFTSEKVKKSIKKNGVNLISYRDLKESNR